MKPVNILLLIAAILCISDFAFGQTWKQQTNAPSHNWSSIACSADGSKLVAVNDDMLFNGDNYDFYGSIYISTNSGTTWIQATNAPLAGWIGVASSADGNHLVALPAYGPIYSSIDSGITWMAVNTPSSLLNCIASSADGTKLVAGEWNDFPPNPSLIFTSTNSGSTWATNNAPSEYWTSIACSADGTRLVAVGVNPNHACPIFTSVDSGKNWNMTSATQTFWGAVASSADGVTLLAAVNGGQVYASSNSGTNWTVVTNLPSAAWDYVSSSADGARLVAAQNYGGTIYTSTNSGMMWMQANVPSDNWLSVACSTDGNALVAVSFHGLIYSSKIMPRPRLNFAPSNSNLALSWLIPSMNFVPQQSSNLISWVDLINTPALSLTTLQNQLMLSPSNRASFFRLSTP